LIMAVVGLSLEIIGEEGFDPQSRLSVYSRTSPIIVAFFKEGEKV
jgi:hypothetical protein